MKIKNRTRKKYKFKPIFQPMKVDVIHIGRINGVDEGLAFRLLVEDIEYTANEMRIYVRD